MAESAELRHDAPLTFARDGIEWCEIEGEITLVDRRASQRIALNRTGSLLWSSLAEGVTRDYLVGVLVGRFGIGRQQAATDVDAFLDDLAGRGFLHR